MQGFDRGVTLLVADLDIGQAHLARPLGQGPHVRTVDVDGRLADTGLGRRHAREGLTLPLLVVALGLEVGGQRGDLRTRDSQVRTLLAWPVEQPLMRFLAGESLAVLRTFLGHLDAWHHDRCAPHIVLVLSSAAVSALRRHLRGKQTRLREIHAHAPLAALPAEAAQVARREILAWIREAPAMDERAAEAWARNLGSDLRYLADWLGRRLQAKEVRWPRPDAFLADRDTVARIQRDLRGLEITDLLTLALSTEADAESDAEIAVPLEPLPGTQLVADRSGRRRMPTESDASQPGQDPAVPQHVQGSGMSRSRSIQVKEWAGERQVRGSMERLRDRGLGKLAGDVFRTGEPYRTHIRRRYDEASRLQGPERDATVLAALAGTDPREHPLVEELTMQELATMPDELLACLLPPRSRHERQRVQMLARQWKAPGKDETPERVLREVLGGQELDRFARSACPPWADPLLDLHGTAAFGIEPVS